MNMANDLPILIETLRGGIVSDSRIGEFPSLEIVYLKLDVKVCVGRNVVTGGRAGNDGRDHIGKGGDVTHSYRLSVAVHDLEDWSYGLDCKTRPYSAAHL